MQFDDAEPRQNILVAALLDLMTQYAHLQCLALHPRASAVVPDTCASPHNAWTSRSSLMSRKAAAVH